MAETSDINRNLGELEEELEKIKSAAELITESRVAAEKTIEEASNLRDVSSKLLDSVNMLVKKIDKVDFPSRLDKVDATISGINSGMQNIIARFDTVERHFDESIKQIKDEVRTSSENINNKLDQMELNLGESNKFIKFSSIVIIFLVIVAIVLPFIINQS